MRQRNYEPLISFVKRVFELSALRTAHERGTYSYDLFDDEYFDIFELAMRLKRYGETIEEKICKADKETLAKQAVEISKEVGIKDIWKYVLIFNSLYKNTDFADDAIKVLYENASILAPSWQDAVTLLSKGLKERSASPGFTWNGLSEEQNEDVEEYVNGCFFLGIQASIERSLIDSADAANGIDAWVLGYGNCNEYGGPVGDIIEPLADEGYWYNGSITDYWIQLLLSLHETDVEEFHTDDGTNWEDAAEDLKMNTL